MIYKNNSDGKGNSYGCHENYLVDRAVPFSRIVHELTPHLVTRQIYAGAGKIGEEVPHAGHTPPFQLSQRADFFEEEVGLETTLKRPIINTRDEPHADAQKYRRLHVIVGDRSGRGGDVLEGRRHRPRARDDRRRLPPGPGPEARPAREGDPGISRDTTLRTTVELAGGGSLTALEVQWELYDLARKYAAERGLEALGNEEVARRLLDRWEAVLTALDTRPAVARHPARLGCRASPGRRLQGPSLTRLGRPEAGRHRPAIPRPAPVQVPVRALKMERLTEDDEVAAATTRPPETTRAYFRGRAWSASPPRSSRPTGTRSFSTSGRTL